MLSVENGDGTDLMRFLVPRMLSVTMIIAVNVYITLLQLGTSVSLPTMRFVVRPKNATSWNFYFVEIKANANVARGL